MRVVTTVRRFGKGDPWLVGVMWVNGMLSMGLGFVAFVVVTS